MLYEIEIGSRYINDPLFDRVSRLIFSQSCESVISLLLNEHSEAVEHCPVKKNRASILFRLGIAETERRIRRLITFGSYHISGQIERGKKPRRAEALVVLRYPGFISCYANVEVVAQSDLDSLLEG